MKSFLLYLGIIACLIAGLYCLGNHSYIAFAVAMMNIAIGLGFMAAEAVRNRQNRFPNRFAI